jgi:hypothetical protein
MANLKLDLLNKLNNDKYFEEMELVRLAGDPNMNYKQKVEEMSWKLSSIALLNAQLGLVGQYFPEQPQVAPQAAPQTAPQGQVHQGQSHGE